MLQIGQLGTASLNNDSFTFDFTSSLSDDVAGSTVGSRFTARSTFACLASTRSLNSSLLSFLENFLVGLYSNEAHSFVSVFVAVFVVPEFRSLLLVFCPKYFDILGFESLVVSAFFLSMTAWDGWDRKLVIWASFSFFSLIFLMLAFYYLI